MRMTRSASPAASLPAFQAGAILAALGVALGAFATHGLKATLEPGLLANFETGVRYQMYAALALLVLGMQPAQKRAPTLLLAGAVIFSGTLYILALTGLKWLGAMTPIGGVLLIAGFVLAAVDARRSGQP
ncbi:DUF423 domain-containing protein [Deinococcus saxicola]